MESLAVLLEPHRELIANAASVVTFCHLLSGVVICNKIRRAKTTAGESVLPFLAGVIISAMAVQLGAILDDLPTIRVNSLGVALNIAYICFFYNYTNATKEKTGVWVTLGYGGAFLIAVIGYCAYEDPKVLPFRYGILFSVILFVLVGLPLLDIPKVLKAKTTHGWPAPIIFTGTLISFLWTLHGLVNRQNVVVAQNGIVFLMSVVQLYFIAVYGNSPASPKKGKKPNKKNN